MKNHFLTVIWLAATLLSCTKSNQESMPVNNQDTLVFAPVITRINDLPDSLKPTIVDLSKMPEPFKIILPGPGSKPGSFTTPDGQVVKIDPLEKKLLPAFEGKEEYISKLKENNAFDTGKGGLPHYTTYTTDDGLAMNSVTCAAVDKSGHIWFGTWGQGISRFDGKHFTNFSGANYLIETLINSILVDKAGNIWIGTRGRGVSRYDGIKFTSYWREQEQAAGRVKNMAEGDSGKIWINTEAGIWFYNPKTDSVHSLNKTHPEIANYTINCLNADKTGNIWFGTNRGAICFNPGKDQITEILTEANGLVSNYIYCIHEDKAGKLWFGTNKGRSCYDAVNKGKPKNYTTQNGLISNEVRNILEDSKGKLWCGTAGGAVSCFEKIDENERFTSFYLPFTSYNLLTAKLLAIDSSDKLWIGTQLLGAICMDPPVTGGSGSFITFSEDQGLPFNGVSTIYEDSKGYLWINSSDVLRFDGTHFTYLGFSANFIFTFFTEDLAGRILAGGYFPGFYCAESLDAEAGISLTGFFEEQGITGNTVALCVDRSGNIWFSSWDKGVIRYDRNLLTHYNNIHGLGNNMIRSITEDKFGNIWFGTAGGGISCFSPSDGGIFKTFSVNQGLASFSVNRIITDSQGNLWIATDKGINFLGVAELKMINDSMSGKTGQDKKIRNLFKTFTTDHGLPVNNIPNIVELRRGKMAIGSGKGLAIFSYPIDSMETFKSLHDIEVYNIQNGYPVRDVVQGTVSMFVDSKGILWIAALSEKAPLIRFDYDALHRNGKMPTLTIRQIKINEEAIAFQTLVNDNTQNNPGTGYSNPIYIADEMLTYGKTLSETERQELRKKFKRLRFNGIRKFYPIPENLVIPHKHNRVTIGFGTSELIRPQLVEYQYILEGYDKEWSPVVKNTTASFGNINEGNYTFKVKARYTGPSLKGADDWTDPVTYTFRVLPPWYRSWLAYLIYSIIMLTGFWRVYLYYKERILRLEREKAQKRELEHAHEIETAYHNLEVAHENLKSTQSQLIQSEKMASLGQLTAGIAHEIQNPLNFVNNFSEVNTELIDELDEEAIKGNLEEVRAIAKDIKENEQKINHHGKRADSIVKGMLQHSRSNTGHKEPTDINSLADEYLRLSYHGMRAKDKSFNAEYKTDFDPNLPKINVVPQDIGRVLLNLINNAFYAVDQRTKLLTPPPPKGGIEERWDDYKPTVTISTASLNPPPASGGRGVRITVKDNGEGIPSHIVDKIFQPFFTTKPTGQGTGLGLSLAYDIVKAHGGVLKVETKPAPARAGSGGRAGSDGEGEGSEFILILPA
jgi:signal transduction histidine kinase/ligand-binding sensor domain-containing protein